MDARLTYLDIQQNKLQSTIYQIPEDLNFVVFKMFKALSQNESIIVDMFKQNVKVPCIPCNPKTVYLNINELEYELVPCEINATLESIKFYVIKPKVNNSNIDLNTVVPLNINIANGGSLVIQEVSDNG